MNQAFLAFRLRVPPKIHSGLPCPVWGQYSFSRKCQLGHTLGVCRPFDLCYNDSILLLWHKLNHML